MQTCMYIHTYIIHISKNKHTHGYVHIEVYTYNTCTHMNTHRHTHTNTCIHMHIQSCMHIYTQQDEGHNQVYCNSYKLFLKQICGLGVVAQSCHLGTGEAKTGGRDFEIRLDYLVRHYLNTRPKKVRDSSEVKTA